MKPHKWAKEIHAWADGAEIEWKALITYDKWTDVGCSNPMWHRTDVEFRIKPQPCVNEDEPRGCYRVRCQLGKKCVDDEMSHRLPQPKEPQYLYVYMNNKCEYFVHEASMADIDSDGALDYIGKIKLETE